MDVDEEGQKECSVTLRFWPEETGQWSYSLLRWLRAEEWPEWAGE